MSVREFGLINEFEQELVLNNSTTGFFEDPEGLGFEISASFTALESGWVLNNQEEKQVPITANIVFGTSEPYTRAETFFGFLRRAKSLRLRYKTTAGEKFIDCLITRLGKNEIKEGNWLKCPITIIPLTLWYDEVAQRMEIEPGYTDGKVYPYSYSYRYQDFSSSQIDVINESDKPAGIEVEFEGPISNPILTIEDAVGNEAKCGIIGTADEGEKIIYSSVENDIYCYHVDENGTKTNLVPLFSLDDENFLYLPKGNSSIIITSASEIRAPIVITVRRYYRIV